MMWNDVKWCEMMWNDVKWSLHLEAAVKKPILRPSSHIIPHPLRHHPTSSHHIEVIRNPNKSRNSQLLGIRTISVISSAPMAIGEWRLANHVTDLSNQWAVDSFIKPWQCAWVFSTSCALRSACGVSRSTEIWVEHIWTIGLNHRFYFALIHGLPC